MEPDYYHDLDQASIEACRQTDIKLDESVETILSPISEAALNILAEDPNSKLFEEEISEIIEKDPYEYLEEPSRAEAVECFYQKHRQLNYEPDINHQLINLELKRDDINAETSSRGTQYWYSPKNREA